MGPSDGVEPQGFLRRPQGSCLFPGLASRDDCPAYELFVGHSLASEEGRRTTRVAGVDGCPHYVAWTRLVLRPLSAPCAPAGSRRRPSGPTDIELGPARRCGGRRARHTAVPRRCESRRRSPRAPCDAPARPTQRATSRWRSPRPRPGEAAPAACAARRTRPGLALPRWFPPTR